MGAGGQTLVAVTRPDAGTGRLVTILTARVDPVGMASAESWISTCTLACYSQLLLALVYLDC